MISDPRRILAERVYYGWIIVVAALLGTTAVYGTSYAFGVFYDVFIEEFAVSRSVLATVFGLQTALIYVVGVGAGRAVDRYGQRVVAAALVAAVRDGPRLGRGGAVVPRTPSSPSAFSVRWEWADSSS